MGRPLSNHPMKVAIAVVIAAVAAGRAHADTSDTCAAVDADAIAVDGMLDDWQGVDRARIGGSDRDASFDVRCALEGATTLAMSFDLRDEHVVRSAVAVAPGDDLLTIKLAIAGGGAATITIAPGLGKIDPQVKLDGKPAPRWLAVETTLQPHGWSAELAIPLARLRGWKPDAALAADVRYRDGDVMGGKTPERTVGDTIALGFEGGWGVAGSGPVGSGGDAPPTAKDTMKAFLAATGLDAHDVTLDASGDVDPTTRGAERVVAGKRVIGIVGARFSYVQLPADRDADVIARPRLVDLRGDGTRVIVTVVRQSDASGAGSRDVLLGFGARGGTPVQLFAIEVRRERGGSKLESAWSIEKGRVVVRAKPAVGWDADSYDEAPAGDAEPIALPWDDDRWGASYTLSGDALTAHKLAGKRPR